MKTPYRMEGLTLTVASVRRSADFYGKKLGMKIEVDAAPHFALVRAPGGTIGLLSWKEAKKDGATKTTPKQRLAIHVELSTDDLDALYKELKKKGVRIKEPPHDEPWERSMTALDPDGYAVEFAQGRRGKNAT
jgi:catechol 2,3-dioxygenase-like lactoylglutathione lyase family enzyme